MGHYFADGYSLLHFASGVIMYYWGVTFKTSIILHTLFEMIENTAQGVIFINTYGKGVWPGGKLEPDALINSAGDTVFFALGWFVASLNKTVS